MIKKKILVLHLFQLPKMQSSNFEGKQYPQERIL